MFARLGICPGIGNWNGIGLCRNGETIPPHQFDQILHSDELREVIEPYYSRLTACGFRLHEISGEVRAICVKLDNKFIPNVRVWIEIYDDGVLVAADIRDESGYTIEGIGEIEMHFVALKALLCANQMFMRTVETMQKQIADLEAENAELRLLPGAPDHLAAKAHFEQFSLQ